MPHRDRKGIVSRTDQPLPQSAPERKPLTQQQQYKAMQSALRSVRGQPEPGSEEAAQERYRIMKATLEREMHDALIANYRNGEKHDALYDEVERLKRIIPGFDHKNPGALPDPVYTNYSDWEGEEPEMEDDDE